MKYKIKWESLILFFGCLMMSFGILFGLKEKSDVAGLIGLIGLIIVFFITFKVFFIEGDELK